MSTAYTVAKELHNVELRHDHAGVDLAVFESLGKLEKLAPFLAGEIRRMAGRMGPVARVAIHALSPGASVQPHVDKLDGEFTRLHFPVTAPVYWWDEDGGDRVLEQGRWSDPVPYNRLHSVSNPTDKIRVTVIVDFANQSDRLANEKLSDAQVPR